MGHTGTDWGATDRWEGRYPSAWSSSGNEYVVIILSRPQPCLVFRCDGAVNQYIKVLRGQKESDRQRSNSNLRERRSANGRSK